MILIWFAADVLDKFKDRGAMMRTCESCVAQYAQAECKRVGILMQTRRVESHLCAIVREALLENAPHLGNTLDVTFRQLDRTRVVVEVRLKLSFRFHPMQHAPLALH